MSKDCPAEVIHAGAALIKARRSAESLSAAVDLAVAALGPAVDVMTKEHGAKRMQAGATLALLRQAQMAHGLVMDAHDKLRAVLAECDVAEPTDRQILAALGERDTERQIASIR